MKTKEQVLLENAYTKIVEAKYQPEDGEMQYLSNIGAEELYSNEEDLTDQDHLQFIAEQLFDIGARIKSKAVTINDGEFLQEASVDLEKLVSKIK